MAAQDVDDFARHGIRDLRPSIAARGNDESAVGAEGDTSHAGLVRNRGHELARARSPEPRPAVLASGRDERAVGAQCRLWRQASRLRISAEASRPRSATGGRCHPRCAVRTVRPSAEKEAAVTAVPSPMTKDDRPAGAVHVPDTGGSVLACADRERPVGADRSCQDRLGVAAEQAEVGPRRSVPDSRGIIGSGCQDLRSSPG